MANIEKIKVGSTSYDVRDASAAHTLTDVATAGTNITFETPTIDDYSIQGTGVTVSSGIASGFTSDSFIYKSGIWNNVLNYTTFEFITKFKLNSLSNRSPLGFVSASPYYHNFDLAVDSDGTIWFRFNDSTNIDRGVGTSGFSVTTGTDYWVKLVVVQASSVKIYTSTDGTNYTERASAEIPNTLRTDVANFQIGRGASKKPCLGSIDLTQTYFKDGDGNTIWAASAPAGKPSINASVPTVDQTYDSTSVNAQSGAAINGAKFLRNLSTGSNSVDVNYAGTANNSVTMGANTTSASSAITFGSAAQGNPYGVSIGRSAGTAGAAGNNSVAIGNNSSSAQYTNGCTAGTNSTALGSMTFARGENSVAIGGGTVINYAAKSAGASCIAIGANTISGADSAANSTDPTYTPTVGDIAIGMATIASGGHAIQLGQGTNTTAQTLNVGFGYDTNYNPLNYQLLDSTGTIPSARMPSDVLKNTATGTTSLSIAGTGAAGANVTNVGFLSSGSYMGTAFGRQAQATGSGSVAIGCNANTGTSGYQYSAIAIGLGAVASRGGAIMLGNGKNTEANTFKVSLQASQTPGVATDEASGLFTLLKSDGKIPGERMALQGSGAPTTATVGSVGQFYVDTTNQVGYMCVSDASSTYVWKQITA